MERGAGVERRLQSVVTWIRRTSLVLTVVAGGAGLLLWLIVRGWLSGPAQLLALAACLAPAAGFLLLPLLVRRVHRQALALVTALRGKGEQARAELPRLQAALERFQQSKRWSRISAGRELLGELNTARSIATDVGAQFAGVQAAGTLAGWCFALGFIGLLALVFTIPGFAIARVFV